MAGVFNASCHADYSIDTEDHTTYCTGWLGTIVHPTDTSPWVYRDYERSGSVALWGKLFHYGGGGYVLELGDNRETATNSMQEVMRKCMRMKLNDQIFKFRYNEYCGPFMAIAGYGHFS